MRNLSFYGIISIIGFAVRTFLLPNPFKSLGVNAEAVNLIAGAIIPVIAYISVGVFYGKGSSPTFGSFCFTLTYAVIVGILYLMGLFKFRLWAVVLFALLYIALVISIKALKSIIQMLSLYETVTLL